MDLLPPPLLRHSVPRTETDRSSDPCQGSLFFAFSQILWLSSLPRGSEYLLITTLEMTQSNEQEHGI